jgi:hypothetical protein
MVKKKKNWEGSIVATEFGPIESYDPIVPYRAATVEDEEITPRGRSYKITRGAGSIGFSENAGSKRMQGCGGAIE